MKLKKNMTDNEKAVIEDFAQVAREAVSLMERIETFTAEGLIFESATILPRLYLLGFILPEVEIEVKSTSKSHKSPAEWARLRESISRLLDCGDCYMEIFNSYEDTEVLMGSLSGDFTDICQDLEGPLFLYDQGEILNATWEWRNNFYLHTGEHITSALRAMYWLGRYCVIDPPDEEQANNELKLVR